MKTLLLAGAGRLNLAAGVRALRRQWRVIALRRSKAEVPAGIEAVQGDLRDRELLAQLGNVDAVSFAATPDSRTADAYRSVFVEGAQALADAFGASARMVFVSSTAVYGDASGLEVTEASESEPQAFNGQLLREAEQLWLSTVDPTVLRLGGIYGPGRHWLIRSVANGSYDVQEDPPMYTNRIHEFDAIRVLLRSVDDRSFFLPRINVVDTYAAPEHEIGDWLADRLSVAPPARVAKNKPNRRVSSRLLQEIGYRFAFPDYRSGYERELRTISR